MAEEKHKDHRDLGQELDLFSFHEIAPGAPFWHPKGIIIFRELEKYARHINDNAGYQEISTPIMVKKDVFEKSGHWEHFRDNMFWFKNPVDENETLVLKPMNCPESTYIYNSTIRSYKDLPLKLAELGRLHRNELSGTLGGLFRVRQITMDDAHIYVRPDQAEAEIQKTLDEISTFYDELGFEMQYFLATRPQKALGEKSAWEKAEHALENSLKKSGKKFKVAEGEGAFYGPKIEVNINDSQGRDWQLGTTQVDLFMLPEQFDLSYIDETGQKQRPWAIHRAIFGSFERFIGIMLEHFNGALPFWLSPVQVRVLTVNDKIENYAKTVVEELKNKNIRTEMDFRNESIGKKIREGEMQKIPFLFVIGEKEEKDKTVAIRERGKGDGGSINIDKFVEKISSHTR